MTPPPIQPIQTLNGVFQIVQQLDYGDLIICLLLSMLIILQFVRLIFEVATKR